MTEALVTKVTPSARRLAAVMTFVAFFLISRLKRQKGSALPRPPRGERGGTEEGFKGKEASDIST